MKRIFTLFFLLFSVLSFAQMGFNYQSVLRNSVGELITDQNVTFMMTITNSLNDTVYREEHHPTTSSSGVVSFVIGEGSIHIGDLSLISWGDDDYYLGIELDETGGSTFQSLGNSKLQAVPYAMYAQKANEEDGDPSNELQSLSISGDEISISDGNTIQLPAEEDASVTNELQTLSALGNEVSISSGNSIEVGLDFLVSSSATPDTLSSRNYFFRASSTAATVALPTNPRDGQIIYATARTGGSGGMYFNGYNLRDGSDYTSAVSFISWDDLAPAGTAAGGHFTIQLIYTQFNNWQVFNKY